MLRSGDVVQIQSTHALYGGMMFVIAGVKGEVMTGTLPGLEADLVSLSMEFAGRKIGRVETSQDPAFYGVPTASHPVSYRCKV